MTGGSPRAAAPGADGLAPPTALRGPVFVTTAVVLAVVAHLAGGGQLPDPGHLVVAGLVAALCWAPASHARHGLVRALARVGAVQLALHVVLSQSAVPDRSLADPHAAHTVAAGAMAGPAMPSPLMWAAHALAAVLLALWLLRGERAVWAAVVQALLLLAGPGAALRLPVAGPPVPPAPAPRGHRRPVLPAVGLRAPPLSA